MERYTDVCKYPKRFLYIAPFKKDPYYKIGISGKNFQRITYLHRKFGLDIKRTIIITSPYFEFLHVLERILLDDTAQVTHYLGQPGCTEIRHISTLGENLCTLNSCSFSLALFQTGLSYYGYSLLK